MILELSHISLQLLIRSSEFKVAEHCQNAGDGCCRHVISALPNSECQIPSFISHALRIHATESAGDGLSCLLSSFLRRFGGEPRP